MENTNKRNLMVSSDNGVIYGGKVFTPEGVVAEVKLVDQEIDETIPENKRDFCPHCGCFNGENKGTGRWDDIGSYRFSDGSCCNCGAQPGD
ncbi:MAG: hypothetical protein P1P90_04215 [Patescibacteria group bacterium]|nr:hypothetical protein [Patescibacteria group bacterium]